MRDWEPPPRVVMYPPPLQQQPPPPYAPPHMQPLQPPSPQMPPHLQSRHPQLPQMPQGPAPQLQQQGGIPGLEAAPWSPIAGSSPAQHPAYEYGGVAQLPLEPYHSAGRRLQFLRIAT